MVNIPRQHTPTYDTRYTPISLSHLLFHSHASSQSPPTSRIRLFRLYLVPLLLQARTLPSLHLEPLNLKRLLPDADVVVAKIIEGTILVVVDVVVVLVADEVVVEAVETLEEAFPEIP